MAIQKRRRQDGKISYRVQIRRAGFASISKTFRTLSAARTFERTMGADIDAGRANPSAEGRRHTLADAIQRYSVEKLEGPGALKTAKERAAMLEWWGSRLGRVKLADLRPALISDAAHKLETEAVKSKTGRRQGPTINRYLAALSAVLKLASKRWHWIETNPARDVERHSEGRERERKRVLTGAEWKRLEKACRNWRNNNGERHPYLETITLLGYYTGARFSALRFLRWEDTDLQAGTAYARPTAAGTKNSEGLTITIIGPALDAVRRQHKKQGGPKSGYVFPALNGGSGPADLAKPFRRAAEKAGLWSPDDPIQDRFTFHSLRHSCLTENAKAGATEYELMAISGHKTPAMVKRYTHTGTEDARRALRRTFGDGK